MPKHAKVYALTVIAIGALTVASAGVLWTSQSLTRFLVCLCLALLGSTFKVKLPGMESCISSSFIPLLFSAATMSWQETVVMAAAAGILQTLWKPGRPAMLIQVLFNGANLAIALGVGYTVSHAVAPNQLLAQLAIAAVMYEVINTLSVSTVVCLVTGSPLRNIWRNCHLWTFPYYLIGAVLACVWAQSNAAVSLSITLIGATTLYLASVFYQELVERLGSRDLTVD